MPADKRWLPCGGLLLLMKGMGTTLLHVLWVACRYGVCVWAC